MHQVSCTQVIAQHPTNTARNTATCARAHCVWPSTAHSVLSDLLPTTPSSPLLCPPSVLDRRLHPREVLVEPARESDHTISGPVADQAGHSPPCRPADTAQDAPARTASRSIPGLKGRVHPGRCAEGLDADTRTRRPGTSTMASGKMPRRTGKGTNDASRLVLACRRLLLRGGRSPPLRPEFTRPY